MEIIVGRGKIRIYFLVFYCCHMLDFDAFLIVDYSRGKLRLRGKFNDTKLLEKESEVILQN